MAYEQNQGAYPRTMHQGNWKCSSCGGAITELPFAPDESRVHQLLCRDCHKQKRGDTRTGDRRSGGDGARRPMHQGNWKCSSCGAAITELPFEPDESRLGELLCRDCHKQKRGM
jgi:CxxC-x17-CxxC domain-containing protein